MPPRMADPCGTRVHCTGLNSPTLPQDQVTCALHTRRGATHSPLYRPFTEASLAGDRSSSWAPASGWQIPRYRSALHRSQHPDSTPRLSQLTIRSPVRCTPAAALPIHLCTARSRKPAWQVTVRPLGPGVGVTQLALHALCASWVTPAIFSASARVTVSQWAPAFH